MRKGWSVRAFDGSLRDASGILAVDQATFGDCHYGPETIVALISSPDQYAWVAVDGGQIVGFVSAFHTHSLAASRWEVDELAVHPSAQGQGIGAALVACALEEGVRNAFLSRARALVSVNNVPSQRVCTRNGFSSTARADLLLYEVSGRVPRPSLVDVPLVRGAVVADAAAIASLSGCPVARVAKVMRREEGQLLVAVRGLAVCGYAERIHVRTLQYEGIWVESLAIAEGNDLAARALFHTAIEDVKRREAMDEIGYLIPPEEATGYEAAVGEGFKKVNQILVHLFETLSGYEAAVGEGFKKVNEYLVFERELNRESVCL